MNFVNINNVIKEKVVERDLQSTVVITLLLFYFIFCQLCSKKKQAIFWTLLLHWANLNLLTLHMQKTLDNNKKKEI